MSIDSAPSLRSVRGPRLSDFARRYTSAHSAAYVVTHWRLLWRVTRSESRSRYAGSLLGGGWVVLAPLLILGVYAAVYLVIFPLRPDGLSPMQYVLYIFAGLAPFLALAEALGLGVASVAASRSVLSNVVFPIDLVPAKAVLMAQGPVLAAAPLLLAGTAATGRLSWTAMFVPVLFVLNVLAVIGLMWVLSLLNVVFRDLQNLVGPIVMMLLIASPIAYTPGMVPGAMRLLILLNPFAYFVIAYQKLWVLGELPTLFEGVAIVAITVVSLGAGGWFFARAKRALLDYV